MTACRGSNGFTLVEMMMAILVMTVGLLGLLQAVIVAYDQKGAQSRREESYRLAEEALRGWSLQPFANVTANDPPRTIGATPTVTRSCSVIGLSESKKLTVNVDWLYKGKPVHHEVFTIKTKSDHDAN